ncbi:MAG: hypothetical protein CFE21_21565 [Bacteroidetes bacterium B1(2017)]|nr:MAG: hypothetical protein CFE21_21565 [Bacteroidetes bacterium B1(2017)]
MQKQLYPSETIDYALETYLPNENLESQLNAGLGELKNYRHCKRFGDCQRTTCLQSQMSPRKTRSIFIDYKATLKKGMSLKARFIVTKQSLFQLLYAKADDWVNPNLNRIN